MINVRNVFDQPIRNYIKANDNIRKTYVGQGDNNTTDCLLGFTYFNRKTLSLWQ